MNVKLFHKLIAGLVLIFSVSASANDSSPLNSNEHECFALSMIGFDQVINSRVGVPIEHALNTMTVNQQSPNVRDIYKMRLKGVVQHAFRWGGSPHEYAVKVLFSCAARTATPFIGVSND